MRRIFFSVFVLLMVVTVVGLAQTTRYTFTKNFPSDAFRTRGGNGVAGVAVDPDGKIWMIPYDVADSILVASTGKMTLCRVVYVFNPDGTQASFSPIKTVTVAGKTDTLWNSQVGMRADANGNIVFGAYDTYYRLNYKTGAGMNKIQFVATHSVVQPGFDDANEMFIGGVIPPAPIKIYDNTFTFLGNVVDSSSGYARSMEVSADGNDVFWAGYTNNAVYKYHSDFGTLGNYSKVDTVMKGLSVESITRNRKTGVYWASGGSGGATVQDYHAYKWYAFAPTNLNKAIDSIVWNGPTINDPRPRGLAFSPGGDTAFVAAFGTNTVAPLQMFVKKASTTVTFWANTSTVPDTLKTNSFVQIRGTDPLMGPWSSASSMIMANVAGDYWKYSVNLHPGDTILYKFFTNANKSLTGIPDKGWENNTTDPSGNRVLIVPKSDTVLPLQFVNGTPSNQPQYFTPYPNQKDSIEVWFRINMASDESFSKTTQFVGVRGAVAPLDWGKSIVLKQESQHGNGDSQQYDGTNFWSGYARFPKSAFASTITYKYVILDAPTPTANVIAWESLSNGPADVDSSSGNRAIWKSTGISDTTLYWKWWSNTAFVPFKGSDTVIVTFRANMQQAISQRGFTIGDTLQVRSGYGGTASAVRSKGMVRSGLTGTVFTATDTVVSAVGKQLNYQYYLVKSGNDVREVFYDFNYTGTDVSQAERRKLNVASKNLTTYDTSTSAVDMRRMPKFQNLSHLTKAVKVTYTLNLRPAYYQVAKGDTLIDIQGTNNITKNTNIKQQGVIINGPAVGGWGSWGPALATDTIHKMYDDGTHGDAVAGDSIYTIQVQYQTTDYLGQEFKFGIGGSDNEGGKGGYGNNHIENIDDSQTTFVIANDYGSINPSFYSTWDFTLHQRKLATAVGYQAVPLVYALDQNYPNPFNPSTTIRFTLATSEIVTLKIFNVLGQQVMVLLHDKLPAGVNSVRFDASKLTSGVYFYQINAGKFVETKKMMLLK